MNTDDIQVLILQNFATVYYDLRFFVNNFFTKGIDDLSVERPKSTQIMHQNIANVYFTIRYPGTVGLLLFLVNVANGGSGSRHYLY